MECYLDSGIQATCSGCGLCKAVCPQDCISMETDIYGFDYPKIDLDKCINCNLCRKTCSNICVEYNAIGKCYAAVNNNREDLLKSSSGGMYIVLAKYVLEQGGVVVGVEMDDLCHVRHAFAETLEDAYKFCGSKYVRSDINDTYRKTIEILKEGRLVLFTGTSCQINSIKKMAKKYEKQLITCEIVCHANPSPKVYETYIKGLEKKYKKKVDKIEFRTKKNGWKDSTPCITFDDNTAVYQASYFLAFVRELISRESCHSCVFARPERVADFTIADLWGIETFDLKKIDKSSDEGVSFICVNSKKAEDIFLQVSDNLIFEEIDYLKAFSLNHGENKAANPNRGVFLEKIALGEIDENNIISKLDVYCGQTLKKKVRVKLAKIYHKFVK